jgi:seryl-tRNA(Sec) selenium transferase
MGGRYDRRPLVKVLSEHQSVTGQVHTDVTAISSCFFSRPVPVETDDASGCLLRSNESLTKETVVCFYTCDQ